MFGDLGKMFELARRIKTELPRLKAELATATHHGRAGGGAVEAVVNGKMELVELKLSPGAVAAGDAEALADLVKAAVAAAQARAAEAAEKAFRQLTGGMDLGGMEELL